MLSQKQVCDRATRELREIGTQLQILLADRKLYRKLESEVIAPNSSLASSNNPYLAMIRAAYTDATIMRLRRLFAPDANLSLRRLLVQISDYPELLHDKLTGKELASDIADLDKSANFLKEQLEPHFSPRERTSAALDSTNRELDRALDLLADCAKRYYWIVSDSYLDLDPAETSDTLAIFHAPWLGPK
jgi:hypothetical protein